MTIEALQIPKQYVPGWENISAGTSLRREGIGLLPTEPWDFTLCFSKEVLADIFYLYM